MPDSLSPHLEALAKSTRARGIVLKVVGWVFVAMLVPAWQLSVHYKNEIDGDHIAQWVDNKRLGSMENAQTSADKAASTEAMTERSAVCASTRALVEYVAGARKQNVSEVLYDYDALSKNWCTRSPECLDLLRCPDPAKAARTALAVRRN